MSDLEMFWRRSTLNIDSKITDVIHNLNDVGLRIVLVEDSLGKFVGTVSDGDVRRGLLRGLDFTSPIGEIVNRTPLVVPLDMPKETVRELMRINKIQQIPVIDENQCLVGLHLWDEISSPSDLNNLMVIMAGGKGVRLLPYTESCPKPMVLVGDKPMLQHIIERAKSQGFKNFLLAVHHLGNLVEDYFGDGRDYGVKINYLREETPLGTAGALSLINPAPSLPFVVTNADVMTDISYGELLDFHNRNHADATMAVRVHEWQNPFGVVQVKGLEIVAVQEKPVVRNHINAGVYVLSPCVLAELISNTPCGMPTLFERLHKNGKRTLAYPMHESWLDVGRPDDLKMAADLFRNI